MFVAAQNMEVMEAICTRFSFFSVNRVRISWDVTIVVRLVHFDYVPRHSLKSEVAADIRVVFNAPNRGEAEALLARLVQKYRSIRSELLAWPTGWKPNTRVNSLGRYTFQDRSLRTIPFHLGSINQFVDSNIKRLPRLPGIGKVSLSEKKGVGTAIQAVTGMKQ